MKTLLLAGSLLLGILTGLFGCYLPPDPLPARPVAQAGLDRFATAGIALELDGSASTSPNGELLSYTWHFERVPENSLLVDGDFAPNGSTEAVRTSFVPDRPGHYVIRLHVDDALTGSIDDFVLIEVEGSAQGPLADAGIDQSVLENMAVYLDGSHSTHPRGETLYYRWRLEGTPELSTLDSGDLVNAYTPFPSLIVDAGGVFTFSLVVSDGISESDPDYVFVTVLPDNAQPVALAGGDRLIESCKHIELDGSSSYDLNGDALSYAWDILIAPIASLARSSLSTPDQAHASFYADRQGTYAVELVVFDGLSTSQPAVIELTATGRAENAAPLASAGDDQTLTGKVTCGSSGGTCPECPALTVGLIGSASSDPDEDPLTYAWSVADGSQGSAYIVSPQSMNTTVELRGAKTALGLTQTTIYRLQLQVKDCPGDVNSDVVELRYQCTGGS